MNHKGAECTSGPSSSNPTEKLVPVVQLRWLQLSIPYILNLAKKMQNTPSLKSSSVKYCCYLQQRIQEQQRTGGQWGIWPNCSKVQPTLHGRHGKEVYLRMGQSIRIANKRVEKLIFLCVPHIPPLLLYDQSVLQLTITRVFLSHGLWGWPASSAMLRIQLAMSSSVGASDTTHDSFAPVICRRQMGQFLCRSLLSGKSKQNKIVFLFLKKNQVCLKSRWLKKKKSKYHKSTQKRVNISLHPNL